MLMDHYPVCMDECTSTGIRGGCGPDCGVYLNGFCPEPQEMLPQLKTLDEIMLHSELYIEKESG